MNTIILIPLLLAAAVALLWATARFAHLLASDGYGHRPIPPAHYDQSVLNR